MKQRLYMLTWILTLSLAGAANAAEVPLGFKAMERLDLLPGFLPNGTQTKQFITYDPSGTNLSGFFKRYEENGEYVFFDEIGPGYLCRQQMNVFSKVSKFLPDDARIRYYFDDETKPRIDMTFSEFFGKDGKYTEPFSPPLAYYDTLGLQWKEGPGTYAILYYPIPFSKRLKITAYHPQGMKHADASWFQYTYLKYPAGTAVESWKGPSTDSPAVRKQFDRVGEDPKPAVASQSHKSAFPLNPGETKAILDLTGQGAITSLRLKVEPWSADTFFHTRIRITWDNQAEPAVDMPISSFFGAGGDTIGVEDVSGKTLTTLMFGFDAKTGQCYAYWPMPYWSHALVELINDGKTPLAKVEADITVASPEALLYRAGENGYFRAKRTIDISAPDSLSSHCFSAQGRGKVVGLTMYSTGYNMDGDEYTFIDGSRTPQIHGDGTEDDHNQGWGGYAIQKPYWGGLVNGFQGGYRLYLNEPYVFDASIEINYEHSKCGPNHDQKTDFTIWYYQDAPGSCNLKLTDELDVGKPESEKAHNYRVTQETWSGITESSYDRMEYEERKPTTIDDGRAFSGTSEFTIKIDPNNEGVKIRRRVNRNRSNVQRTDVYVDGKLIPDAPWYVCDLAAPADVAYRDTEYEIPAVYTKGKSNVTIQLRHISGQSENSSNEYYYWVYSYGKNPVVKP